MHRKSCHITTIQRFGMQETNDNLLRLARLRWLGNPSNYSCQIGIEKHGKRTLSLIRAFLTSLMLSIDCSGTGSTITRGMRINIHMSFVTVTSCKPIG